MDWDDEPEAPGPPGRGRVMLVLAVVGLLVVTLVLCCATLGPLGEMFQLRLPPL